ncbi:LOW QUALITY PROTEIN: Retrovirus Polyprotein [Phytophthora palmivora]|uniref:Retrovirus Polyprotein n=1 Tax=Phytophthora palmivora TaxID=4796 RepID=A0A2P4XQ05_9STRA|nr:LOW QUALITY PROTEIN: Retrovirus Polyprotein [Phytophthora palmivora]
MKLYAWDKDLQRIIKTLKLGDNVPHYSLNDGVLYYQTGEDESPRLYIPDDEDLRNRVICENHGTVTAGHPGSYKTYVAVREKYYWPRMMKYIQRYCNTCEMCQRNKARQVKPPGLLQPLDVPRGRWIDISMDFVVSLPSSKDGYNAIMVIVDRLTKRAKFIATQTTDSAEDTANIFMKSYVKDHGLPKTIVSDRDSNFTSKFWQAVISAMGTQHNLSSAFRPQTDGQTERTNRFIGDYLRGVVNPAQSDWDEFIHMAEFAYNRRVHATIGMSPFEADLGYIPYMPDDVVSDPEFKKLEKAAREFLLRQEAFLKVAQDRMSEAQERMKYYYDRNRLVQDFKTGDMVLLDGKNLDIRHKGYAQSKKLAPMFIGPFPVQKKISRDSYELGLSKNLKLHPVFHTSLLKPYRKDPKRRQKVNRQGSDGTEGQLVEAVINHRKYKGKPQYKIWWLGETKKDATWEPFENLKQIPGLIDLYWKSKKIKKPY